MSILLELMAYICLSYNSSTDILSMKLMNQVTISQSALHTANPNKPKNVGFYIYKFYHLLLQKMLTNYPIPAANELEEWKRSAAVSDIGV